MARVKVAVMARVMAGVKVTVMAAVTLAAVTACGAGSGAGTGGPGGPGGGSVTSGGTGANRPGAAATDLTVVVDDGSGNTTTWHLTCDPPGGDHPDPATACRVLASKGDQALPPVPGDRMCTQIYGGPQTARITGKWRGKNVDSRLSRTNGCEIARWNALAGLLPRGGA